MKAYTSYTIMAAIAIVGTVSIIPAIAELPPACPECEGDSRQMAASDVMNTVPISVWTDKESYDHESSIMLEGKVATVKSGEAVTVIVRNPINNIVTVQQLDVARDGMFMASLNTAGSMWKEDGIYTIKVQYGGDVTNKVQVTLTGGMPTDTGTEMKCGASELEIGEDCLPYSISGATVTGATTMGDMEDELKTMTINIDAMDDGTLVIEPMRQGCNEDGDPIVIVSGEQWDDYTFDGSTVEIMFPAGTDTIDIIGACVVPEFGTIAMLILAIAVMAIAVSARSRLGIMPKF